MARLAEEIEHDLPFEGPAFPYETYIPLREGEDSFPKRDSPESKEKCLEALGLGPQPDIDRYGHLKEKDLELLRWAAMRGSGCMWLPSSPRTKCRGFLHRLITRGPPVRLPLHQLSREAAE